MLTAKELLKKLSEVITLNCRAMELLGVPLRLETLQVLTDTALALIRDNYPNILPDDGTLITRLCGEECNCAIIEFDDTFSAILQSENSYQDSTFIDLQNNTLQ